MEHDGVFPRGSVKKIRVTVGNAAQAAPCRPPGVTQWPLAHIHSLIFPPCRTS